jgi:hypothetical protein
MAEENIKKNKIYFFHKKNELGCQGDPHTKDCFGMPCLFLEEYDNKILVTRILQDNLFQNPYFMEIKLENFKNFNFYSDNQIDFDKKTYINPTLIEEFDKSILLIENSEKETLEATFDQQKFFKLSYQGIKDLEEEVIDDKKSWELLSSEEKLAATSEP